MENLNSDFRPGDDFPARPHSALRSIVAAFVILMGPESWRHWIVAAPDQVVLFRPESLFDLQWNYVSAGKLVFILQTALIAGLLAERAWRRRKEREAQRTRERLAQVTRNSAMDELAASLAHEINQPLTSILLNAQTASHLLASREEQTEELKEILRDIVDDDKRASEVIVRIRKLAGAQSTERTSVNLNTVVREIARLVDSDLLRQHASLDLNLAPELAFVEGGHVQLQQVVLNLLLNAFEAVSLSTQVSGKVIVQTEMNRDRHVHVIVRDNGPGLQKGAERKVFDPFVTTKKSGMGMGLSIARSLVESHGGAIWANPNSERGAEFHFTIPAAQTKSLSAAAGRPVE